MFGRKGYGTQRIFGRKAVVGYMVIHRNGFTLKHGLSLGAATKLANSFNSDTPNMTLLEQ